MVQHSMLVRSGLHNLHRRTEPKVLFVLLSGVAFWYYSWGMMYR